MKTWAIVSQKGGVGKSTFAASLAGEAQSRGEETLVIDTDPQNSLYMWSKRRAKHERLTPVVAQSETRTLSTLLQRAADSEADLAIIDTPGKSDAESRACIALSDLVIIPIRQNIYDLDTVTMTIRMVKTMGKDHVMVVNGLRPNSRHKFKELKDFLEGKGAHVAPFYMAYRAAYADSPLHAMTPQEYEHDKRGKCTREITDLYNYVTSFALAGVAA